MTPSLVRLGAAALVAALVAAAVLEYRAALSRAEEARSEAAVLRLHLESLESELRVRERLSELLSSSVAELTSRVEEDRRRLRPARRVVEDASPEADRPSSRVLRDAFRELSR